MMGKIRTVANSAEFLSTELQGLSRLFATKSKTFDALVRAAKLDPTKDFRQRDLRDMCFEGATLDGFNFFGSNLLGTKIRLAKSAFGVIFKDAQLDDEDIIWLNNLKYSDDSLKPTLRDHYFSAVDDLFEAPNILAEGAIYRNTGVFDYLNWLGAASAGKGISALSKLVHIIEGFPDPGPDSINALVNSIRKTDKAAAIVVAPSLLTNAPSLRFTIGRLLSILTNLTRARSSKQSAIYYGKTKAIHLLGSGQTALRGGSIDLVDFRDFVCQRLKDAEETKRLYIISQMDSLSTDKILDSWLRYLSEFSDVVPGENRIKFLIFCPGIGLKKRRELSSRGRNKDIYQYMETSHADTMSIPEATNALRSAASYLEHFGLSLEENFKDEISAMFDGNTFCTTPILRSAMRKSLIAMADSLFDDANTILGADLRIYRINRLIKSYDFGQMTPFQSTPENTDY